MVVVNDMGGGIHGEGVNGGEGVAPADAVVAEIKAAGGLAVADRSDISDFDGAAALVKTAVENFGSLDAVINNAGILRDRMLVSMSPDEFDAVVAVHLRGHFNTTRHAAAFWREQTKEHGVRDRVLVQTTSIAGLHGNMGQFNYSAAKSAIATMAINGHLELNQRYGVRNYAIAPSARTRLTLSSPGAVDVVQAPADGGFDFFDPANVAPFVVWLASEGCSAQSGVVYGVEGDLVRRYRPWSIAETVSNSGRTWTFADLDEKVGQGFTQEPVTSATEVIELTNQHIAESRASAAK
jgi:NAD(P)-dependent dehydrogenase (short-subunit alcohol dehydrogenase family)